MAKIALLIGVSEYSDPGLNSLPAATRDIVAVETVLSDPNVGGFDVQTLPNPNRQQMEEAIERLFRGRHPDDVLLLYFSGHGIDCGKLFFATYVTRFDSKGELIWSTAVRASFIHEIMNESRAKRQIVILDCCFSGAFAKGMTLKNAQSVNVESQLGGKGRAILTSSMADQYSLEQQGQDLSVYTHFLVQGIRTGEADLNHDGWISVNDLHQYIVGKVQEVAPSMQPGICNIGREGQDMLLSRAPEIDPTWLYLNEIWDAIRREEIYFISHTWKDSVLEWLSMPPRSDVAFTSVGLANLRIAQEQLRLTPEEAEKIKEQALQPYREHRRKIAEYQKAFAQEFRRNRTLNALQRQGLKRLQQRLGLKDSDVAGIEEQFTRKSVSDYRWKLNTLLISNVVKNLLWFSCLAVAIIIAILLINDLRNTAISPSSSPRYSPPPPEPVPIPTVTELQGLFEEGKSQFDQGNHQQAIEKFEELSKQSPQYPEVDRWLADSYTRRGTDSYNSGFQISRININQAINYFLQAEQDYSKAIGRLKEPALSDLDNKKLATLYIRHAKTYSELCSLYQKNGNQSVAQSSYQKAIESYDLALQHEPNNQEALVGRGEVCKLIEALM